MARQKKSNPIAGLFKLALTAAGSWIVYSKLAIDHHLPLPDAINAPRRTLIGSAAGLLSYYEDLTGEGRPLVLLHSINAAGCAYEVRPIFEHYRASRPVYALELPGFGFSERSDRAYTPDLYRQAINDFLTEVVGEPADVIALSLASEFAALAAQQDPAAFNSLTLISPSGFTPPKEGRSSERANQNDISDRLYQVFSFPLWGQAFYDLIATRRSINWFLSKSFEGPIHNGWAKYAYLTAHRPGAHYAPLYFVSGQLFTRDIRETTYTHLTMPVLILHDRDNYIRFDELPGFVAQHDNWQAVRIQPTMGLPHYEQPVETFAALNRFWAKP